MEEKNDIVSTEEELNEELEQENKQYSTEEKNKKSENNKKNEDEEKKQKKIKNVSIKQCIGTIILSLLAFVVFAIPYTFGNSGMEFTFGFLPIIGNGEILSTPEFISLGACKLFGLDDLSEIIQLLLDIDTLVFLIILIFNVFFSLLLIFTRSEVLRAICKVITIIAGICLIFITLIGLIHVVGVIGALIMGVVDSADFMTELESSGILFALGCNIITFLMIKRQFKWFSKLY